MGSNVPQMKPEPGKSPTSHLHALNIFVATVAGIISIVGGVYSLKSNLFQDKSFGEIQGVILDQKLSKPLWQAPVEISLPDGAVIDTINTDQTGRYVSKSLKAGSYIVKASAPLHHNETKNVVVERKRTSTINFELVPIKTEEPPATVTPEVPRVNYPAFANPTPSSTNPYPAAQSVPPFPNQTQPTPPTNRMPYQDASESTSSTDNWPRHPHDRRPRGMSSESPDTSNMTQPSNMKDALTQTGVQLLESWLQKKSNNQTQ